MGTYAAIADLPLTIEGYALEGRKQHVSSGFERQTTIVRLRGGGQEGVGEDVTYAPEAHPVFQERGLHHPLAGEHTLDGFSQLVGGLDLFPEPPANEVFRSYRRWGVESAALDLALRQAGRSLADVLGRAPQPVTFVMSLRLGEPATIEPVRSRLALYPWLRFKLDATSSWTDGLIEELVASGAVDSIDLKGQYEGTIVDQGADAGLYERVAQAFPDAWIEDPRLTPDTDAALRPYRDRITWDAIIHSAADVEALPFPPRMVNVKPSRFGSICALFECYDHCAAHGIAAYGGGQFELGPGRGQIQYLASLFHADAPNDIAPSGFNEPEPRPGLPSSPLDPQIEPTGFRWAG